MGDMALKCSLCCDKSFPSKTALIEHLSNILENITCPICSNKWSSVAHLIEHLTLDECQPELSVQTLNLEINLASRNTETTTNHVVTKIDQNQEYRSMPVEFGTISINNHSNSFATSSKETVGTRDDSEESRMYMELRKQLLKPSIQTKEFKLVNDGGITRYVIVTEDDDDADMDPGSQIVTKQNNDGTISLTTVRDMKMETDTVITPDNQETEENQEIYSCNTCGVSFTSVLDHIQNYHNDQDVVVEDSIEDAETEPGNLATTAESNDPLSLEEQNMDKQVPRRMITETGDIVEAPLYFKAIDKSTPVEVKQEVVKKDNLGPVLETDSIVKEINRIGENGVPYHKVVIKEVEVDSEKVKVFNCMSCNIYVSTLDEFKSQPCKILKYHCPHCPVAYENSKSLCAHMKVHKNKPGAEILLPPVNFECEVCNTIFLTNKSLKLHKRMHDPIKARPIQPPVESEKGGEVNITDQFICGVCDKVMPIEYRNIHQNSHKVVDSFNCDICNKKFQSCEYLEMHMNVHTIEKVPMNKQDKNHPYTCLYCDRRFARPHEKVKHERIHTGERPHSCEICGKSFRVAYCLTLHMRTHTGLRPYACPHCGKRFKAHSVYNHHLMTHSEVRAYKCPFCPKAFKTSVQLAGHKNSHTKPFSCQQCNRPFASLYAVRVHTETHARHNNLKFSCSVCGASYARAFALKDHIKQVHNREPDKSDNLTPVEADWKTPDAETEPVTKELPQVVDINQLGIINSNHSNELVVP